MDKVRLNVYKYLRPDLQIDIKWHVGYFVGKLLSLQDIYNYQNGQETLLTDMMQTNGQKYAVKSPKNVEFSPLCKGCESIVYDENMNKIYPIEEKQR